MAKSTKHQDKVGSFDSFRAPWESEAGADAEIDKSKLKRFIFNLKAGEAKALDAVDDAKADVSAAETERDEAKSQAADATGGDAQKTIDKLTKERDDARAERDTLKSEKDLADLRKEVLGDFESENPKAAKYVTGTTKEELEASLEEVKEDWGITDGSGEEDEVDEEEIVVRNTPRTRSLNNPADRNNGKGADTPIDFDKIADEVIAGGSVFR